VTILAFLEALRYDSLAVSLLGWSGGFLTPYLLGTAKVDAVGLFSYMALLVAGVLAVVATKESWVILVPLTYAAAYGTYGLWYIQNYRTFWYLEYYKASNLAVAVIFLSIFWALFYALDVIRIARGATRSTNVHHVVAARNAIAYYGGKRGSLPRERSGAATFANPSSAPLSIWWSGCGPAASPGTPPA